MSYTLPRPSHNWKSHGADFSCTECSCRKALDVDSGAMSTGCTGKSFCFFPGPNFQADPNVKGVTWDQLDGSRGVSPFAHYEHHSESGPTPVPAPAPASAPAWTKAPVPTKPDWQGDFEIGDRVEILDENGATGSIVAFNNTRKMIEVLRDDGDDGSGNSVFSASLGRYVCCWMADKDELVKLPAQGATLVAPTTPAAEPHKMGLDPETIDWSKFPTRKIRDML